MSEQIEVTLTGAEMDEAIKGCSSKLAEQLVAGSSYGFEKVLKRQIAVYALGRQQADRVSWMTVKSLADGKPACGYAGGTGASMSYWQVTFDLETEEVEADSEIEVEGTEVEDDAER